MLKLFWTNHIPEQLPACAHTVQVIVTMVIAASALITPAMGSHQALPRPNVIVILSDDQGYAQLGSYLNDIDVEQLELDKSSPRGGKRLGEAIEAARRCMPHVDSLAEKGLRFTNVLAAPACAPSRAALMSSQYPQKLGIYTNLDINERGVPASVPFLVSQLKDSGYRTGMIGKWHLGSDAG